MRRSLLVRLVHLAATGGCLLAALAACTGDDGPAADRAGDRDGRATVTTTGPQPPPAPVRVGTFDALIPRPTAATTGTGRFVLTPSTVIAVQPGADAEGPAALLRDELAPGMGGALAITGPDGGDPRVREVGSGVAIAFERSDDPSLGREGYDLAVTPERVTLSARSAAGFGWGVQTLLLALPPDATGPDPVRGSVALPAGTVHDVPRYGWRGAMLDLARHWFEPADVERVIDLLARYKFSILHLHLSDDQGWRIEIRAHPELTEVGAATEVGGGRGGFLTQDDYRHLVAYAARRGVTVVPEIDLPGHTNAALVSLPWLNCDGVAPKPYTGTSVGFSSLCIGGERTDEFVDTVVGELAALTPGPYLHIGGDESHSTEPADYRSFVATTATTVRRHGKVPVGWEEIGTADIGSNAVVQHWLDPGKAAEGAGRGAGVVLSPARVAYVDMKVVEDMDVGNSWAGVIGTRKAYEWDPATRLPDVDADRILGVEAPLWTETVTTRAEVGRLLLPRLPGYAELGWSGGPSPGGFAEYRTRLATHAARWDAAGWTWTPDPDVDWPD